jgi:hypothetical protein
LPTGRILCYFLLKAAEGFVNPSKYSRPTTGN